MTTPATPAAPPELPLLPPQGDSDAERAWRVVLGVGQAFWEHDLASGQAWFSPQFHRLLDMEPGTPRELAVQRIHPADREAYEAHYAAARAACGELRFDLRHALRDGRWRWIRMIGRFWPGPDGQAARLVGMVQDIDEERRAQQSLQTVSARLERAMESLSEAVVESGVERGDFFLSANLARMLGHPEGTPAPDAATYLSWVHPDDLAALKDAIRRSLAGPSRWDVNYRLRDAAGHWRWVRGRGESRYGADGRLSAVGMVGDIHEFTLAQQELQRHREQLEAMVAERTARLDAALAAAEQARERAERADRAKSVFLAHMSHEIRTPLNGVLGLTELALGKAESPAQRRHLEVALQSGRTLLGVINDVLEISRLETGTPVLADQPFDLGELLAEALRATAPLVGARPVTTRYDVDGGPTALRGDPQRLRQIVVNLLGNAAKFTERGHIDLVAQVQPAADGRAAVRLQVADTGPGMPAEVAARVFEAFYQADSGLSRRHEGTGLGLAIAHGLARAMGGELTVDSTPGVGSTFTLQLALGVQAERPVEEALPPGRAWVLASRPELARWLGTRIERLGWQTRALLAPGEIEPLLARDGPPQLLMLSARDMPLDDETIASLRRWLPTTRINLLVRADWSDSARERQAAAFGITTTVSPLSPRALAALMRESLHGAAPPRPAPAATRAADVLLVEDNLVNRVIGQHLLEHLGLRVRAAHDGAQSLAACLAQAPDLVIMDVRMPVMDGLEATRQLRRLQQQGRLPRFPVVGLSAHALETDRRAALDAGMDDYLTKPIDADRLRQAVQRWMPPPADAGS
ncbi:MAG: response regulator [Rubrivivax sp.]|nr:response regulator [Rubrivivax sp.]